MNRPADTHTKDRFDWLDAISAHPDLDSTDLEVAYRISGHINRRTGFGWPSLQTLATETHLSVSSVKRATASLVKHGFLSRQKRGDGETNHYRMLISDGSCVTPLKGSRETADEPSEHSEGPNQAFRGVTSGIQRDHGRPPNSLKNSLKELSEEDISVKSPLAGDLQDEFEELWRHYPRKVSKGSARRAFRSARKRADFETLLAGVQRYASERAGQEPKYTKHLSTWLTGECWGDDTAPQRQAAPASDHPRPWQTGKDRNREVVRKLMEGDE